MLGLVRLMDMRKRSTHDHEFSFTNQYECLFHIYVVCYAVFVVLVVLGFLLLAYSQYANVSYTIGLFGDFFLGGSNS